MSESYYARLDAIRGNPELIDQEQQQLTRLVDAISKKVALQVTPEAVVRLVHSIGLKESLRAKPIMAVSDVPASIRFLRAIAASVPNPRESSTQYVDLDDLLELCGQLQQALFHREMIVHLKTTGEESIADSKKTQATMMGLLGALQGEVTYRDQAEMKLRGLFGGFSDEVIRPAIGISVDTIVTGFRVTVDIVTQRMNSSIDDMRPVTDLHAKWKRLGGPPPASGKLGSDELLRDASRQFKRGLETIDNAYWFTADDLKPSLGNDASKFLEAFAFTPGTINQHYVDLYSEDASRGRPFGSFPNGRYLLYGGQYAPWAPLFRLEELFNTDRLKERLNKRRDRALEEDAHSLMSAVLQPDLAWSSYYVPINGGARLAERDGAFICGDKLFLLECKAHSIRPVLRNRGDLKRIDHLIKKSIEEAYGQATSVVRTLDASENGVDVYDSDKSNRKKIGTIPKFDRDHIYVIICLDSSFGLLATNLKMWLPVDETIGFPWAVDRDTLETIGLKIKKADQLAAFLRWRQRVQGVAFNEDEAVFAGYFLAHGPHELPSGATFVQLNPSYSDVFDAEYFRSKGIAVDDPPAGNKPVFSSMERQGSKIHFKIDGKLQETIDLHRPRSPITRTSTAPKIGRNDPCPCGSGNKYKRCCLP